MAPGARWTLRARLTVLTSALLAVTLVAGALLLSAVLSRSRMAAVDDLVRARVATLGALVADDRVPDALPVAEPGEVAQLLDAEGAVLATSPTASRTLPVLTPDQVAALTAGSAGGDAPVPVTGVPRTAYDDASRVAAVPVRYAGQDATLVVAVPVGEVSGVLTALRLSLLVVVPVLTALLAAAIWLVLGRALHPVAQLRDAAAAVAHTGGGGTLPVPATPELGALARTLNDMLDRLDAASTRQRSFVGDAAHELRSPVATLRTTLEVAAAHPDGYPPAELVEDLLPEVLRMQALVDDLLLLARVGATPAVHRPVDLAAVAADGVRGAGAGRPPGVAVDVSGAGTAVGDAAALARVVRNLVENAQRHARSRVRVLVAPGEVRVEDDGPGIPAADRDRVFERFVRLDDARPRGGGGTGLGLAIAREVAREHDGDVTLDEAAGGGLVAVVRVPLGGGAG